MVRYTVMPGILLPIGYRLIFTPKMMVFAVSYPKIGEHTEGNGGGKDEVIIPSGENAAELIGLLQAYHLAEPFFQ